MLSVVFAPACWSLVPSEKPLGFSPVFKSQIKQAFLRDSLGRSKSCPNSQTMYGVFRLPKIVCTDSLNESASDLVLPYLPLSHVTTLLRRREALQPSM